MSLWDPNTRRIIGAIAVFCVMLILGIRLLSYFRQRVEEELAANDSCDPEHLLDSFREAFEEGDMDAAEFEKVRQTLERQAFPFSPTYQRRTESADPVEPA